MAARRGRADHGGRNSLLGEGAVEQPGDDGQVLALVEGRQDDRVDVLAAGFRFWRHYQVCQQQNATVKVVERWWMETRSVWESRWRLTGTI
jgi:hypothetical protein